MAADAEFSACYVIGAGYKKAAGAYKGNGVYEDCMRYKHVNNPIWIWCNSKDKQWQFSNKTRLVEGDDNQKFYYKRPYEEMTPNPPIDGWKKQSSPGAKPYPTVLCVAFGKKEDVEVFSKKKKTWLKGQVEDLAGGDAYRLKLYAKGRLARKGIKLRRPVMRAFDEESHKYALKQFVEIKTKAGEWIPAMIAQYIVKDGTLSKYKIVLPDGKSSKIDENRIRNSPLVREALGEGDESAAEPAPAPAATTESTDQKADESAPAVAGEPASNDGAVAAKDAEIAQLKARIAQLEAAQKGEPIPAGVDQGQLNTMIEIAENLTNMLKGLKS